MRWEESTPKGVSIKFIFTRVFTYGHVATMVVGPEGACTGLTI